MYPFLKKLFADGGYQGPEFQKALAKILPQLETEIVKRSDQAKGFVVLPAVGSSSAPSLGSTAAEGLPRIGRTSIARRWHSCASHRSASCSENFVIRLMFPDNSKDNSFQTHPARVLEDFYAARVIEVLAQPYAVPGLPAGCSPASPCVPR